MKYKKFFGAASATLAIVIMLTLMLAPGAWAQSTYKTLHKFTGKDGSYPEGSLIFDAAGNLYGTAELGGRHSSNCYFGTCGAVFELAPNADGTWTEQVLHYFDDDGTAPNGGVIFDAAGNLYGVANRGPGFNGDGVVFKLTHNTDGSWTESSLLVFTGADGQYPGGGLIFDSSGNLYGTTGWGCGMGCVFELTPNSDGSWTEHILYGFGCCGGPTGGYPSGSSLIFDSSGNLYGTTAFGGNPGCSPYGNGCYGLGVIFELSPNGDGTWTEEVLHKFTGGKDGASPTGTLVFDTPGSLYGTTYWGGAYNGNGNVFTLVHNSDGTWTEHVLHQFTGGKDGGVPFAGVVFDAAGNLYGTTTKGGAAGYGVVFKLTPPSTGGWKETVLHAFADKPGANPYSGVIFDAAGNLYGATEGDGETTIGSVFEITP